MAKKPTIPEPRIVYAQKKQGDATSGFTFTFPLPYQPEFADPSRVFWPIDRHQQNRYWRLFYKVDPVISNVIDLFSDIICSDFTLSGEGVEGTVKDTFEEMVQQTKIVSLFPYFIREFLVLGEVIPHLVLDKEKKIWTSVLFHNPDQINVIDSPFIDINPIVEYTPDASLRKLLRTKHPVIQTILSKLSPEIIAAISSGKNIPLDTSLNATFIARKVHPYDIRGTSVLTRLYKILMYEDAISNASIATARRHAGPLKIVKLGDRDVGGRGPWVPEKEYEDKIIQLLTVAEQDPHAFLVLPWFVQFESFGTTDRMMNIRNEWDVIERIKLTALGVSQGFLHGEATYASMKGTVQTLLMRLRGLRTFFETVWWYPKFFKPIAEMNEFVKSTPAQVNHRLRFRRSKKELIENQQYIVPKIQWSKALDLRVDQELLDAFEQIVTRLNLPISKDTVYSTVGLDFEAELTKVQQEKDREKEVLGEEEKTLLEEAVGKEVAPPGEEILSPEEETPPIEKPSYKKSFTKDELEDLEDFIKTGTTDSSLWEQIDVKQENLNWERIALFLEDEGYDKKEIGEVKSYLLKKFKTDKELNSIVSGLSESMSDKEWDRSISSIFAKLSKKKTNESFFIGEGNSGKV